MANQHTRTVTYRTEGGSGTVASYTFDVESSLNIEIDIPVGETNMQITCPITVANLLGVACYCRKKSGQAADLATELTLYTNDASTGSPDDTFVVTPTSGLGWDSSDPTAAPFSVDVTDFYVTNTGQAAAELSIRVGLDATP